MKGFILKLTTISFAFVLANMAIGCSGDSSGGGCGGASSQASGPTKCSGNMHLEGDTCVNNPVRDTSTPAAASVGTGQPATSGTSSGSDQQQLQQGIQQAQQQEQKVKANLGK